MAGLNNELSEILKNFKSSYDSSGELASVTSSASELSSTLQSISDKVSDAAADFKKSGDDSVINSLVANTILAKDGLDRVKSHIDSDIPMVVSKCAEVNALVLDIMDKVEELKECEKRIEENQETLNQINDNLKNENKKAEDEKDTARIATWNSKKTELGESIEADQKKKILLELEIEDGNDKGETQLNAIKSAIDGVTFGVAGNMHAGGALGSTLSFSDGYNFEWEEQAFAALAESKYNEEIEKTEEDEEENDEEEGNDEEEEENDEEEEVITSAGLRYDGQYVVVDNINDLKAAMADKKPVKLIQTLNYVYSNPVLGMGTGWNTFEASENEPLYLIQSDDKSRYIIVDENGNKIEQYKGNSIEINRISLMNQGYFHDTDTKKDGGYSVVTSLDELITAIQNDEPIKIEKNFNYRIKGKWESYEASEEKPIYFIKEGDNWYAADKDGKKLSEYSGRYIAKNEVKDSLDSYFNNNMEKGSDGYYTINNMGDFKAALEKGYPIKLERTFNYNPDGERWEAYQASPEHPLYLKKEENKDNWVVVDQNGNKYKDGKYKSMWINKDRVVRITRGCFGDTN